MKKKCMCLFLTLIIMLALLPSASAASTKATHAADALYELGLFKGTGTNADGTPIFDLDKTPTRNQAVIMLVRLLGKEEEALSGTWELPFTDVEQDSIPYAYIGYAYANGLTNGTSDTTFSGTNPIRANQYITFVLRAMGYTSGEDFTVSTAWEFSDAIGLTHGEHNAANAPYFIRADVAEVSMSAMSQLLKGEETTLAHKLMAEGVFTAQQYAAAQEKAVVPAIDPEKPMLALTFDDGPSPQTARLLDILDANDAKATFFVVGNVLDTRPAVLRRMAKDGHEIGSHSWDHSLLTKLKGDALTAQFETTCAKIYAITGVETNIMRPPYGSTNDAVKAAAAELGISFINWNEDPEDWKTRDADAIYEAIMKEADNGDIILCHDLYTSTMDAMARVIPDLIAQGYQLVTVSELLGELTPGGIYYFK